MKIGSQEIQHLNAFRMISKGSARDCLISENVISFLVKEGDMGLTIGKNGATVQKLRQALKKNVELFEHKKTAEAFVQNAFHGVEINGFENQEEEGKKILVAKVNNENRHKLLGDRGRMNRIKEMVRRNYEIDDIRIGK